MDDISKNIKEGLTNEDCFRSLNKNKEIPIPITLSENGKYINDIDN